MYSKELIYNYIIGNDIDNIEDLENDNNFLFEVLKKSKDITYYNYLDIAFRRNLTVIKYMFLNFKDSFEIYKNDVDYLLQTLDKESSEYLELIILVSNISDNYKMIREALYSIDKIEIGALQNSSKETEEEIGLGFAVIQSKYEDSNIILDYYAKNFLYEIFYKDKNIEEIIHKNIKNKDKLNRVGNTKYLLDYIESLDSYLKDYLESHLYLLDKIFKDLDLIKINWDNYLNRINSRKVNIVYQEVNRFIEEECGRFYFEPFSVIDRIVVNNHLEEIFGLDEEVVLNISLKEDEYLKEKFTYDMTKLIKELFKDDIITNDNSDYDISEGKIIEYKKK